MKTLIIGFSPLIAGLLVRKIFKMLGLGDLTKLSGAVMSGAAGVGKLAGDKTFGSRMADGMDKGIKSQGNKLGKRIGKEGLGDNIADGSLLKAAKVMSGHAMHPRKARAKAKQHREDAKIAKHLREEEKNKLKKERDGHLKDITAKRDGKVKALEDKNLEASSDKDLKNEIDSNSAAGMITGVGVSKTGKLISNDPANKNKKGKINDSLTNQNTTTDKGAMEELAKTREESEKIILDEFTGKDRKKAIKNIYDERALETIGHAGLGGRKMSPVDTDATLKQLSQITGLPTGNISLPNNGLPPLLGLGSNGTKMVLPNDVDQARNIARMPYNYYPESETKRRTGESEEARSGRLHQLMISKGDYDPGKNVYTDMVAKHNISDTDIKLAMAGSPSKLDTIKIEVNSSQSANAASWSRQFDASIAVSAAKELRAHNAELDKKVEIQRVVLNSASEPIAMKVKSEEVFTIIDSGKNLDSAQMQEFNRSVKSNIVSVFENQTMVFEDQIKAATGLASFTLAVGTDFDSAESTSQTYKMAEMRDAVNEEKLNNYKESAKELFKSIGQNSSGDEIKAVYGRLSELALNFQSNIVSERSAILSEFQVAKQASTMITGADVKVNSGKAGRKMITAKNLFEPLGLKDDI
jgi:hypothetical protein